MKTFYGSNRPDAPGWKQDRNRRSTESERDLWDGGERTRTGLGAVMGRISGNLELFEFEGTAEVYERSVATEPLTCTRPVTDGSAPVRW